WIEPGEQLRLATPVELSRPRRALPADGRVGPADDRARAGARRARGDAPPRRRDDRAVHRSRRPDERVAALSATGAWATPHGVLRARYTRARTRTRCSVSGSRRRS